MVSENAEKQLGRYSRKSALGSEPNWSHYQRAVFDWMEHGSGNAIVGAVWGSGKTSLLTGCVNRIKTDESACILTFNVHIKDALLNKATKDGRAAIPSRVKISTANAMGHSILCRFFAGAPIEVDEGKYRKIAKRLVKDLDISSLYGRGLTQDEKTARQALLKHLVSMIRFCQSTLLSPTNENLGWIRDYYNPDPCQFSEIINPLVGIALDEGESQAQEDRVIDFGDQLWLIYKWNLDGFPKKWLMVDEFQDANPAQLHLYKKMLAEDGRAILVGDPAQSIMGFSGSDPEMWDKGQRIFNAQPLPLSVCYRCPTSHLDLARAIVPSVEPGKDDLGNIEVLHPSLIKTTVKAGDLILCRFTAPLVSLCLRLLTEKQIAKVRGRDIGKSIIALAKMVGKGKPFSHFQSDLNKYCVETIEKLKEEGNDTAIDAISDKQAAINACFKYFGGYCNTLRDFCDGIDSLFSDESSPIVLSTIHRAKGDEADRVFLLGGNHLPYTKKCVHEWQEKQELYLLGVALTRARKSLFLVPLADKGEAIDDLMRLPYGGLPLSPVPYGAVTEEKPWPFQKGDWVKNINPHPSRTDVPILGKVLWCAVDNHTGQWVCNFHRTNQDGELLYTVDGAQRAYPDVDFAIVENLEAVG